MNILCTVTPDWIELHLRRFVNLMEEHCPTAKLYCAVVHHDLPAVRLPGWLQAFEVKLVKRTPTQYPLLMFDLLRTKLLDLFGLDEGLYCDVDADIVGDLSELPSMVPCGVGLVRDPLASYQGGIVTMLGTVIDPPYNIGCCYMHRDAMQYIRRRIYEIHYTPEFGECRFGSLEGSWLWNLAVADFRDKGGYVVTLPDRYGVLFYHVARNMRDIKILQYSGMTKLLRPYVDLSRLPNSIKICGPTN